MPRQIIDTESGRPAYVRRRAIQIAVAVLVVLAIVLVAFFAHSHHLGLGAITDLGLGRIAARPGNTVPGGGTTLVTLFPRSIHAA